MARHWAFPAILLCLAGASSGCGPSGDPAAAGDSSSAAKSATPPASAVPASTSSEPAVATGPDGMLRVTGGTKKRCVYQNEKVWSCEGPEVTVKDFLFDRVEVTVDDYARCVREHKCGVGGLDAEHFCNYSADRRGRNVADIGEHPANCIPFAEAKAYCAFVKKRLPTRDEWEHAARGEDARAFPWGSTAQNWSEDLSQWACWRHTGSCKVGTFPPKQAPYELRDMAGNVSEWTAEGVACGSAWLDPDLDITEMVALTRCRPKNDKPDPAIGFRCARSL